MRSVFKSGAVVALLALLAAPAVYADELPPGMQPPEARILPPTGFNARIAPPTGLLDWIWLMVRIGPPIG